jgi:hypothetical protein
MPSSSDAARGMLGRLLQAHPIAELRRRQAPKPDVPAKPWIRPSKRLDPTYTAAHWRTLTTAGPASEADRAELYDAQALETLPLYSRNVENYVGTV